MPSPMSMFAQIAVKYSDKEVTTWQEVLDFFDGPFLELSEPDVLDIHEQLITSAVSGDNLNLKKDYGTPQDLPSLELSPPSKYDVDYDKELYSKVTHSTVARSFSIGEHKVHYALGKNEKAIARVFITEGKGVVIVNQTPGNEYFVKKEEYLCALRPVRVLGLKDSIDVVVEVKGGKASHQVEAIKTGVARALSRVNGSYSLVLKKNSLLPLRIKRGRRHQKSRLVKDKSRRHLLEIE